MNGIVKTRLNKILTKTIIVPDTEALFCRNERILILSPHYDDDVISCFGAMWNHYKNGDDIDVVYVTDGSSSLNSGYDEKSLSWVRKKEAEEALSLYFKGVNSFHLNKKDGSVIFEECDIEWLSSLIQANKYSYIYSPYISDTHHDHKETYTWLNNALGRCEHRCKIRYYEFWMPLESPNRYVDISSFEEEKANAIRCHESQMVFLDYVDLSMTVNHFRGKQIGLNACEFYKEVG